MKKWPVAVLIIIGIIFAQFPVLAAERQTPSGVPFDQLGSFVDDYVSEYIGKTSPGLTVVVVKDGHILFSKGYGFADIDNKIAVDPAKTIFEYGSVSKLFVYTSIMQLVEDGKLSLEEDIRSYLPEGFLRKIRYDDPITLLHVMSHTTGFEDYLFDVVVTSGIHKSFEEILRTGQPEQVYKPGSVSAYSNYAVALAAYIVENMVGQDFYTYVTDNIFLPSSMTSTSMHPELEDKPWLWQNKAKGYYLSNSDDFLEGDWSYIPLYPIGAANGTAEDLARFAIALMPEQNQAGLLLDKRETLDKMLSQSHAMGPGLTGFAHGFIEFDGRYTGYGHGGNTAFFTAQMNIVPEENLGVIVLSNVANEMNLTQGLTQALLGKNQLYYPDYENLPEVYDVEGTYTSARRPHNGFLKLYGFLSFLEVNAVATDVIELSLAGQKATYQQIEPYVYQQKQAEGAIFEYNFNKIYFEMEDGKVQRMSGDFLPLPAGHTKPWLIADAAVTIISAVFFMTASIVILLCFLYRKRKKIEISVMEKRSRKFYNLFILSGTSLLINNGVLVIRMLANNYRSFGEVRPQIILNILLVFSGILMGIMATVFGKNKVSAKKKIFFILSAIIYIVFVAVLLKWQFFDIMI